MAETRTTATLTVDIVESCVDVSPLIQMELDEDLNGGVTCFTPNSDIYFMLFPSPQSLDYSIKISHGSITRNYSGDGFVRYSEYVTITDGDGNATHPIHTLESYEWIGTAPCPLNQLQFDTSGYRSFSCTSCSGSPDCGTSCEVVNGILKITYLSQFHSYVITVPSADTVLITAYENLSGDCS
jgi:hypothetical protein